MGPEDGDLGSVGDCPEAALGDSGAQLACGACPVARGQHRPVDASQCCCRGRQVRAYALIERGNRRASRFACPIGTHGSGLTWEQRSRRSILWSHGTAWTRHRHIPYAFFAALRQERTDPLADSPQYSQEHQPSGRWSLKGLRRCVAAAAWLQVPQIPSMASVVILFPEAS